MVKEIQNKEAQSSYRSIFKAMSLFGGVQIYSILIQIIKSKIIAVLLGPLGVGIQGLYQSALDMVRQATSFGIAQSAVRDVAEASSSGDNSRINRTVAILRKIVWFTGLLGLLSVVFLSPILSNASFGSNEYIFSFIFLSVVLFFDQISAGQKVILQGTRHLKDLAKASAIGITISLAFSIPFYYLCGVKGIVPALILTSVVTLFVSWFYSRRVKIDIISISLKEVFREGKSMMVMGVAMSLSGVMATSGAYLLRGLLRKWGGIDEVGLFQAGFVIINSYVGLVFSAIATDYYPRLAAVNKDNFKCRDVVSKQGEISVFLLAPLLTICILLMPTVIKVLYTDQFLSADGFIKWACLGMMFRLSSWLVSYMFVAKAESKLFIINELIANINNLWLSILGYLYGGITGMGFAFAVSYFVYFCQVYIIAKRRYSFSFSSQFVKSFLIQFILISLCLACIIIIPGWVKYLLGSLFMCLSIIHGVKGLGEKIGIKNIIKKRIN